MHWIPGPTQRKKEVTHLQMVRGLTEVMKPENLNRNEVKDVVLPKKRVYKPRLKGRKPHKQEEKALQRCIINHLRLHDCICGKVKVVGAYWGRGYIKDKLLFLGVPDILCFHPGTGMWWIEVKTEKGALRPKQKTFQGLCSVAGVKHIVARNLTEVERIYKP